MLPQTAKQLTDANRKALQEGLCVPYTKEQHSAIQDCDHEDKRYWNFFLNTIEAYTKKEYTNSDGFDALAMILWNRLLPNAQPYTKQEYSNTYGCSATNLVLWNECLPDSEPFSEDDIKEAIKLRHHEDTK